MDIVEGIIREHYAEQKAEIIKRAAKNGIAGTILHFVKKYPNLKDAQSSEAVFSCSL